MSRLIALLIVLLIPAMPAYAATRAAVFEIELQDTSGEQSTPAQAERIRATTEALRRKLAETGKYEIVDLSANSERISKLGFQRSCVTCFVDIARERGAEVAVFGTVNKVSTLILSMEIKVLSVETGKEMVRGTADIRGDNDRAWLRGMEWLVQHRIVPKESGRRRAEVTFRRAASDEWVYYLLPPPWVVGSGGRSEVPIVP